MPNLHELFDAASDGLPPLPDLAPDARRIVRRRKLATRSAGAALSSALVIGVGTMLIGIHASTPADTGFGAGSPSAGSSNTERAFPLAETFHEEAVSALQQIWPIAGERIEYLGTFRGKDDQTSYAAVTPTASYRVVLAFYQLPANDPQEQPHQVCATDTSTQSAFTCSDLPNGQTVAARVGGGMAEFDFTTDGVSSSLVVGAGPMINIDARKLVAMAKSAIFQQLSADAHLYYGVITPMPGANFGRGGPSPVPSTTAIPRDGIINPLLLRTAPASAPWGATSPVPASTGADVRSSTTPGVAITFVPSIQPPSHSATSTATAPAAQSTPSGKS